MASLAKIQYPNPTLNLKINLHRRFPQKLSLPAFSRDLTVRFPIIRASSSTSSSPKRSLLKQTCIVLTASAALFSATYFITRPGLRPPVVTAEETRLETHLETRANDIEALLSLTKIKYVSSKFKEAIEILNRMIEIEPKVLKWQVMKARILSHNTESESAIKAFEEILLKDPNLVDAYHYLVMEYFDTKPKLIELETRINEAIRRCKKKWKKAKEIRGFRMMIAQIKVIQGNSDEAIRIIEELEKEDPKDFKTYFFKGFVYQLMNKEDEATTQFQRGAYFFPENHPYRDYSDDKSKDFDWGRIVAYDDIFCSMLILTKLYFASQFSKFGFKF